MMAEIKAPINPNALVGNLNVLLGIHRPLALRGDPFTLKHSQSCINSGIRGNSRETLAFALCLRSMTTAGQMCGNQCEYAMQVKGSSNFGDEYSDRLVVRLAIM